MRKTPSWVSVVVLGVLWWAGAVLAKHWWSHEPWGHALLAGVPFGMLALIAAGSTARAHHRGERRRA